MSSDGDSDSDHESENTKQMFITLNMEPIINDTIPESWRLERLENLLSKPGADVNAPEKSTGKRLLHIAIKKNYETIVKYLLETRNININVRDKRLQTPLHLAVEMKNVSIVKQLLAKNPDLFMKNKKNYTPLELAERKNSSEICTLLAAKQQQLLKRPGSTDAFVTTKKRLVFNDYFTKKRKTTPDVNQPSTSKKLKENYSASGLKHTLHGTIYQLKLLMLYCIRGFQYNIKYKLATEMDDAEKFDDLYFEYETQNGKICNFLQAKHKQDETKTITRSELFENLTGEFSLPKYFLSYMKIKEKFIQKQLEHFIICTNINFEPNLKDVNVTSAKEIDLLLTPGGKFCKLEITSSELYEKFQSEALILAKEIIKHVIKGKILSLTNPIFKQFHVPLSKEIIQNKTLSKEFVDGSKNLSDEAKKFRKIFTNALNSQKHTWADIGEKIKNKKLVSANFGKDNSGNSSSLPTQDSTILDIEEFLNKLTFAVNQPNEIDLGKIIGKEIETHVNQYDCNLIISAFQENILNWFKQKQGTFLTDSNYREFCEIVRHEIDKIIIQGVDLNYRDKLEKMCVNFETDDELVAFLESDEQVLCFITQFHILGTLKVFDELKKNASDNYLFVQLNHNSKTLLKRIANVFNISTRLKILIVECQKYSEINKLFEKLLPTDNKKKLIVITPDTNVPCNIKKFKYNQFKYEFNFEHLNELTRNELLTKQCVLFQGRKNKLQNLIKDGNLIDAETCVSLIENQKIFIGLPHDSKVLPYYIERKFFHQAEISLNLLNELDSTEDVYFLVNISKKKLCEISKINPEKIYEFETNLHNYASEKVVVFSEKHLSRETFVSVIKNFSLVQQNVHLLEFHENNLIWKNSTKPEVNSFKKLLKNRIVRNNIKSNDPNYKVSDTILKNDKIIIISDVAGMGKTSEVSSFVKHLKKLNPTNWVVVVNLNNCTQMFGEESNSLEEPGMDFFINKIMNHSDNKLETNFETSLFKGGFKSEIVVIFDGFDEISPTYKGFIANFLQNLKKTHINKIIVTTRPHTRQILEEKLQVFCYVLLPFSDENKIDFLGRYWAFKNQTLVLNEEQKQFAKKVVVKLSESIKDKESEFTGIPLQLMMVAEIFENNIEMLETRFSLTDLFTAFFKKKCQIFKEDKGLGKHGNVIIEASENFVIGRILKYCRNLSVKLLLSKSDVALFNVEEIFEKEIVFLQWNLGIVTAVENRPEFIHRTFAEYLFATQIALEVKSNNSRVHEFLSRRVLLEPAFEIVRYFLDGFITATTEELQEIKLDMKIQSEEKYSNSKFGETLDKIWRNNFQDLLDENDQSILTLTAKECNLCMFSFIVDSIEGFPETTRELIDVKNFEGVSVLHVLASLGLLDYIESLVKKGGNIGVMDDTGQTVLHYTAENRHWNVLKSLHDMYKNILNIDYKTRCGRTVLHCAVSMATLEEVEWVIEVAGASYSGRGKNDRTVIHYASENDKWDVVMWFVENKNYNINYKDSRGTTVFYTAALKTARKIDETNIVDMSVMEELKNHNALVHVENCKRQPIFCFVNNSNHEEEKLKILKWLKSNGADFNAKNHHENTILHVAVLNDCIETVKWLILKEGVDPNTPGRCDKTALIYAAMKKNWDLVEWLIKTGNSDLNRTDKLGLSVLHVVAQHGNLPIIELLIEHGIDLNKLTRGNVSFLEHPLHYAAAACSKKSFKYKTQNDNQNREIIKLFLQKGCNLNVQNSQGCTIVHIAAKYGDLNLINMLVEELDMDYNILSKGSESILHFAAWSGNVNLMKWLLHKNIRNINDKSKNGRTLLFNAVKSGSRKMIEYLECEGLDINAVDLHNNTLLHVAASHIKWDLVMWLIGKGVDCNKQDIYKNTILHSVVKYENWVLFEELFHGKKLSYPSNQGISLINTLARKDRWETVILLIKNGVEVQEELKALNQAVLKGRYDIVKWLIKNCNHSKIIHEKDKNGETILHKATERWQWDTVRLLIEFNADVNLKTLNGNTVLHLAVSPKKGKRNPYITEDHINIIETFVRKGVDIEEKNNEDFTAEDLALKNGFQPIVDHLQRICGLKNTEQINQK